MTNDERERRARDWIAALCDIPTRFAGSLSEHAAAEKVGAWMREIGVDEITTDAVVSRPRTGWTLALHAGVAAFGLWWGGLAGVLIACVAAWSFQREFSGGPLLLSTLLPSPPSLNVIGRAGPARPRRRVILSAHIDTAQAGWLFSPALADTFARGAQGRKGPPKPPMGPLAVPRALILGAALLAAVGWMGAHGFVFGALTWIAMGGLLLTAALTLQWANSPATPGANDNASAVASMLTATETILAGKPEDVEVWLVGTGAEEVGCRGMHGFVERRLDWERDETFYLNFECTGGGALHYIRSEGVLGKFGYPPALLEEARRQTRTDAFGDITPTDLLAATDGHVPAHHGYPTLSLISLEANGVPRNYHRPEDTVEAIDLSMVVRAADFGAAVVLKKLAEHDLG
jgi:hypothetical protein